MISAPLKLLSGLTWPLSLILAAPVAAQGASQDGGDLLKEIDAELDKSLTPTGAAEPGWSDRGASLESVLKGRDGADRVLFTPDADVPSVTFLGADPGRALSPAWTKVRSRGVGEIDRANAESALMRLSPTKVLAVVGSTRRVGNALCPKSGVELSLYERPGGATEEDEVAALAAEVVMGRVFERLAAAEVCTILTPRANGRYAVRSFLADGRPLGRLDEGEEASVPVPATEAAKLLGVADEASARP